MAVEENAVISQAAGAQTWLQGARVPNSLAAPWGLDRIDQTAPSAPIVDDSYTWCTDGAGVRIYVVDTGVLPNHPQFGSRVDPLPELASAIVAAGDTSLGAQCWRRTYNGFTAEASHGTAVASVAAGSELGVAKLATIVDARAATCGGTFTVARIAFVLDWINRHDPRRGTKSVINISGSGEYVFGDPAYSALNAQIASTVDTYNIPVVVAAGNANLNAYWYSPANASRAITVGGLAKNSTTRWSYSNYGYTVSFYAPAQYVEAATTLTPQTDPYRTSEEYRSALPDCGTDTYPADTCTSGTSFAAPHVSGVVARYLQAHPGASRDSIVNALTGASATYGGAWVTEPGGRNVRPLVFNDCF